MQVHILEAKGKVWEGVAGKVNLPASGGDVCVMDFHQPFFIRLKAGYIRLAERPMDIFIKEGLAFMHGNELQVFIER